MPDGLIGSSEDDEDPLTLDMVHRLRDTDDGPPVDALDKADTVAGAVVDAEPAAAAPDFLEGDERYRRAMRDIEARRETIDLAHIGLTALRPDKHLHRGIVNLDIYDNRLTELPNQVGELLALESLDASDNTFEEFPMALTNLSQVVSIDFSENNLSQLPKEIYRLGNLRSLRVAGNQLLSLPAQIGGVENLTELDVDDNMLAELPEELGRLRRLVQISATRNLLTALPEAFFQLRELRTLLLNENQITTILPAVRRLRSLRQLDLSANRLTELPEEIGLLRNLRVLNLEENEIHTLPSTIGTLAKLEELDLSSNELETLPRELGYLRPNILLYLDGNPLAEPISTLYRRGVPELLSYLRSLENSAPQYEARLLLVGEGGVGKSSLVAALRDETFVEGRPTTHGIEINELVLPHPELDVDITLNTWDFGGQEVYRISHQFFFSRRALYLCVWKPREGQDENGVEAWCRRIRLRVGDNAKIIVVATHSGERRAEFDFSHLQAKFPRLVADYICVDSETGEGIAELRATIAHYAAQLPQMGELLNNNWRVARDEVLKRDEANISRLTFERICAKHGLSEESAATLAVLLHDLGHVINYSDDEGLRELVVLRPEWLTKAIGYVLEDTFTRTNAGVLPHDQLDRIWSRSGRPLYPAHFHPYFLRLMEKFDVSYRLPDAPASLVAQLVPYERPESIWQDRAVEVRLRRHVIRAICRTAEEAPGIVAWLTVRNHRFSVGRHWRRGVVLEHRAHQSEALIELLPNGRDLRLTVLGPTPDYFFHVLKDSVEDLIKRRWAALPYEFLVPCGVVGRDGRRCVGLFSYTSLVLFRERRERRIPCQACAEWHDVDELLSGLSQPTGSLETMVLDIQRAQQAATAQFDRMESSIWAVSRRHRVMHAQTRHYLRSALKMLTTEVTDCPRLFTLTPVDRAALVRTISPRRAFTITLWCEESGNEHPWSPASYDFRPAKEWISEVGPYVKFVGSLLRFVVPVAGAAYAAAISPDELSRIKADIDLTKTLAEKFPQGEVARTTAIPQSMTRAEGAGLRAFRSLMIKLDPAGAYGDLRRVVTSSGDVAWVCPQHHALYDPGLPVFAPPA